MHISIFIQTYSENCQFTHNVSILKIFNLMAYFGIVHAHLFFIAPINAWNDSNAKTRSLSIQFNKYQVSAIVIHPEIMFCIWHNNSKGVCACVRYLIEFTEESQSINSSSYIVPFAMYYLYSPWFYWSYIRAQSLFDNTWILTMRTGKNPLFFNHSEKKVSEFFSFNLLFTFFSRLERLSKRKYHMFDSKFFLI